MFRQPAQGVVAVGELAVELEFAGLFEERAEAGAGDGAGGDQVTALKQGRRQEGHGGIAGEGVEEEDVIGAVAVTGLAVKPVQFQLIGENGAAEEAAKPIDDIRGSAAYKKLLLGRLVRAHFMATAAAGEAV